MDNIKKFEDFLDRMQGLLDNAKKQGHIIVRVEDLEHTFPELKESEDERIKKEIISFIADRKNWFPKEETKASWIAWLEKQGEQKFHEGDWVILTAGELSTTLQIVNVDTNKKLYWFNDGSYLPIVDEECLRLWSIHDAKDGDILAGSKDDVILMFRGIGNTEWSDVIDYHCCYDWKEFFVQKGLRFWGCVKPATKKQRDLLFQKMKESGYEWDVEKKELRKLEQKPRLLSDFFKSEYEKGRVDAIAEMKSTKWSEEDEKMYAATIFTLAGFMGNEDKINWLQSLKDRVQPQPKREWSKVDESHYQMLQKIICDSSASASLANKLSDWLNSLKDRVQPQPNQEWSEEDEKNWQGIWDEIWANKYDAKEYEWDTYDRFLNWLKSIKQRVGG